MGFKRWSGHEGGVLMKEISDFVKGCGHHGICHVRIQHEDSLFEPDIEFSRSLILAFSASRTARKDVVDKPPGYGIITEKPQCCSKS